MSSFPELIYDKVRSVIEEWIEPDIYAISFFVYSNMEYEYGGCTNVSSFAISYNTEADCGGAGRYDEERWNYAFWRQDETPVIDPDNEESLIGGLFEWYSENGIENIGYEDESESYDEDYNYIGKGPVGHYELVNLVSDIAKRLNEEGIVEGHFGRRLPIIVHGLDYAWYDIEATVSANPNGEADDFLTAMKMQT